MCPKSVTSDYLGRDIDLDQSSDADANACFIPNRERKDTQGS